MTELHTASVLDQLDHSSTQEISTLDHSNLEKSGTGDRHSVNTSILMPISETALQVVQYLPSSTITEIHTSDHDLEKSGINDSEKASISMPVPGPETETFDIEHVPVQNDPRKWSSLRKVSFLTQVSILSITSFFFFFCYPLSYIACYPGVNLFCIFNRWTWREYTESWVYMSTSLIILPNYHFVLPSCGRRDGNRITSNPFAIQLEHCSLFAHPRRDAALLECNKRG